MTKSRSLVTPVLSVLLITAASAAPAGAQEPDPLAAALLEHRHTLELTAAGVLRGPGAELLLAEGAASQFFMVGEEHGIAEVPQLTAALFRQLQRAGRRPIPKGRSSDSSRSTRPVRRSSTPARTPRC